MPISVRLPLRVEQRLAEYCVAHELTKSQAVKLALELLAEHSGPQPDAYRSSARFRGCDKSPGDVARHSKRLLREYFRNKTSLG